MPYDLAIMQRNAEHSELIASLGLPYTSGSRVSGAAKAVQQFIAELLTIRGSRRFRPDYGCNFLNDIRGRNVSTLDDLQVAVTQALSEVTENSHNRITREMPADEIISEVTVDELIPQLDSVLLSMTVHTYDRQESPFQLPLHLNNENI
ncbi:MAG: hypothetical protein LBQ66_02285 [Planctomycetaceae bacterium]|jgi:hypothetical protein|nr:hypothetical protein [Planctomycetaceae bacterium]